MARIYCESSGGGRGGNDTQDAINRAYRGRQGD
jgi:hypothetical protein